VTGSVSAGYAARVVFGFDAAEETPSLELRVEEDGWPFAFAELTARVSADAATPWGSFTGGGLEVELPLVPLAGGAWIPERAPTWQLADGVPAGAATPFTVVVTGSGDESWTSAVQAFEWIWRDVADPLDFQSDWPGQWSVDHPVGTGNTTWHRWLDPAVTADGSAVLAAVAAVHDEPRDWPDVLYANETETWLTTTDLGPQLRALRLVHALDVEMLVPGVGIDGGTLEWVGPRGVEPASPVAGFPQSITPQARHALHGRQGFAGADSLDADGRPTWRVDLIPLPDEPGPWRLRLRFASDRTWRGRGWLVARLDGLGEGHPAAAFPVAVDAGDRRLRWTWPWESVDSFRVERRPDDGAAWQIAWSGAPPEGAGDFAHELDLAAVLPLGAASRWQVRVVALTALGGIASRAVVCYPGGSPEQPPALGRPYPNPGRGEVRIPLSTVSASRVELTLYDLRGRRVRRWDLTGGDMVLTWDGRDDGGRPVAAGTYLFRLQGAGDTEVRKVVWLR
jgi:hypothetical protein